jgi:hypothetical protein
VSVSVSVALEGLTLTLVSTGAVLLTVTVLLVTALPEAEPSFGVTAHATVSPASKSALVRVAVLAPIAVPLTCHA